MKAPSLASAASAPPDEEDKLSTMDRASSSMAAQQVLQAHKKADNTFVTSAAFCLA
jgi:hypothetical protein